MLNPSQVQDLTEFKDAAIAVFGGNAYLFFTEGMIPAPQSLAMITAKCERLLAITKKLQGASHE